MAQTGFTPIQLYSTSTAAAAPVAGNLTNSTLGSELAINITDGKLFYKDNANAVQVIGWKTVPTTAGGTGLTTYTAGDLSYYASGTTFTKLAIGANTTILTSTGSAPQWSATSGITVGTATNLAGGLAGSLPYQTGAGATTFLGIGASGRFLSSTGSAPQWSAPAALTETDDTNVTMTLGGTPSTALLSSVSMTLGWTGQLAVGRGGTGLSTLATGYIPYGAGASAFASSANFTYNGSTLSVNGSAQVYGSRGLFVQGDLAGGSPFVTGGALEFGATATEATIQAFNRNSFPAYDLNINAGTNLNFKPGTTLAVKMFASGGVSIGNTTDPGATNLSVTGNVVIATSGKGIDFSATPGTGTSELLNDYEEGTWTPADNSGAGLILTITFAKYTKVGRQVSYIASITYPATASGSAASLTGFPFTASDAVFGQVNYTTASTANLNYMSGSTTALFLLRPGVNTTNAQMSGATLIFSGTYFV